MVVPLRVKETRNAENGISGGVEEEEEMEQ